MSVRSVRRCWVVCDRCGVSAQSPSERTSSAHSARAWARIRGWSVEGGIHVCPPCCAAVDAEIAEVTA